MKCAPMNVTKQYYEEQNIQDTMIHKQYISYSDLDNINQYRFLQGPLLLTWFNFNPSMDKLSHGH